MMMELRDLLPAMWVNHLKFPKWFVGLILRTITPPTIGIAVENQWGDSFRCQS